MQIRLHLPEIFQHVGQISYFGEFSLFRTTLNKYVEHQLVFFLTDPMEKKLEEFRFCDVI